MGELLPMPRAGDLFADARGDDRTMRVSWHAEADTVVVSLWAGRTCRASFRLPAADVPRLIETLTAAVRPPVDDAGPAEPTSPAPAA